MRSAIPRHRGRLRDRSGRLAGTRKSWAKRFMDMPRSSKVSLRMAPGWTGASLALAVVFGRLLAALLRVGQSEGRQKLSQAVQELSPVLETQPANAAYDQAVIQGE